MYGKFTVASFSTLDIYACVVKTVVETNKS